MCNYMCEANICVNPFRVLVGLQGRFSMGIEHMTVKLSQNLSSRFDLKAKFELNLGNSITVKCQCVV